MPKTDSLGVINEYTFDEKDVPENYKKRIEDNIIINEYSEEPPTSEEPPVNPPRPEDPPTELSQTGIGNNNLFVSMFLLFSGLFLCIRKKKQYKIN